MGKWSTAVAVGTLMMTATTAVAGCSSRRDPPLEGTTWKLVSIQSMDDAQGTTTVPDPTKFTVSFDKEGQVFFQLDCNRGKGTYKIEASGDGSEGKLQFGPIATTMMMCPQPSLDQQVGKALADVRTYLFKDNQLHLSKVADGGILTWQRA